MSWHKDENEIQNPENSLGFLGGDPFNLFIKMGLFLISASSIAFEINLTRLFSVAQFYHFAFMIVSTALLGSAASGIVLMIFPKIGRSTPEEFLSRAAICASLSMIGAYLVFNWLPFDSFSISWDIRQVGVLVLHYFVLSLPFFFCGLVVSLLLDLFPERSGSIYAVNLTGSSMGCLLALSLPGLIGSDGMVMLCSGLTALGVVGFKGIRRMILAVKLIKNWRPSLNSLPVFLAVGIMILTGIDLGYRLSGQRGFSWMALKISPYKSLSYAMQFPGAIMIDEQWNAFSRINLVNSPGIRSLPGLSYRYQIPPPPENGLFVDGDDLSAVLESDEDNKFSGYMPVAVVFQLRPGAKTLILEPRGGLDIMTALSQSACCITAIEQNPLIVAAAGPVYTDPKVKTIIEFERSYLKQSHESFDVILISLTSTYHPIQSGAYSLAEDYRYTVEALSDSIKHLNPKGILVFMRWLQDPPSEDLRAFALAIEAVEQLGGDPQKQIVTFRGYNTTTLMIKRKPFTNAEMTSIRGFLRERAFDLSYSPDVRLEETNQYNILPKSVYYQSYTDLIDSQDRQSFYRQYPYDITPPTDDHPFMGHYFKWSQARQIIAEWGKTWQPFGGAGYLVVIGLLILTLIAGSGLALLPWIISKIHDHHTQELIPQHRKPNLFHFGFFACIGFAYLLVEIPLIQKFILFLGQPAYAFAIVLFAILFFSGCGSLISHKIPLRWCLVGVIGLVFILPIFMPVIFERALGFVVAWRMVISILLVAPLGILMGIPFPAGLRWIVERGYSEQIPWFWGINGAASVVSAILAAMLALAFGFAWVLRIGAIAYILGWLMVSLATQQAARTIPGQ